MVSSSSLISLSVLGRAFSCSSFLWFQVVFVVGLPALLFWLALFRRDPIFDAENVWHRVSVLD